MRSMYNAQQKKEGAWMRGVLRISARSFEHTTGTGVPVGCTVPKHTPSVQPNSTGRQVSNEKRPRIRGKQETLTKMTVYHLGLSNQRDAPGLQCRGPSRSVGVRFGLSESKS